MLTTKFILGQETSVSSEDLESRRKFCKYNIPNAITHCNLTKMLFFSMNYVVHIFDGDIQN